jgi:hypothetical protein
MADGEEIDLWSARDALVLKLLAFSHDLVIESLAAYFTTR